MSSHGTIYWTELNTRDAGKAKAYYGAVMGWTFQEHEMAGTDEPSPYSVALKDGQPVAGIFTMAGPTFDGVPEHWFTYIAVDDVRAAMAAGTAQGGKVFREPFEIPEFGTLAIVADSNGAVMGILEPIGGEADDGGDDGGE